MAWLGFLLWMKPTVLVDLAAVVASFQGSELGELDFPRKPHSRGTAEIHKGTTLNFI